MRTLALMAHVDAGKTTLSEAILYACGSLRKQGRVDQGTTALDSDPIERIRGITVYDAQADFRFSGHDYTLIDTPGHADFAAEALRAVPVLDGAVLLLDGTARPGAHFAALHRHLAARSVPMLLALTKCDRPAFDAEAAVRRAQARLGVPVIHCPVPCVERADGALIERVADVDDPLMEKYLEENVSPADLRAALKRVFLSCRALLAVSVSGLTGEGVNDLLTLIDSVFPDAPRAGGTLRAPIYQVRMDKGGQKVCFARVLGEALSPRSDVLAGGEKCKINEIRRYTGAKYQPLERAEPGQVVGLTGLNARAGDVILKQNGSLTLVTGGAGDAPEAALRSLIVPRDPAQFSQLFGALRTMAEEDPLLNASAVGTRGVEVSIAGPIQLEVLCQTLESRFSLPADAQPPRILYRETVARPVRGSGHYEPLRHYAEVQLALVPQPPGSGLSFESLVPVDELALNWQRLIETHVFEQPHPGFLTGAPLTDAKVVLLAGRAHLKHTEGGDFRQATCRAIRQALFAAENVLLEPCVSFEIALPAPLAGRALADIVRLSGETTEQDALPDGTVVLRGTGPLATFMDYPTQLAQFTHGEGVMSTQPLSARPCHDPQAVIAAAAYDPGADTEHPAWSVFCSHGAGHAVPWNEAPAAMHTFIPPERLRAAGL